MYNYFSNHNHTDVGSNSRFSDSIIRIQDLINRSIELGYKGVNISDHECISGFVKFLRHYKELEQKNGLPEGFKVSLGDEIYLIKDINNIYNGTEKFWHFLLTAKNYKGFELIKAISSKAWSNSMTFKGIQRTYITYEQLEEIIGEDKGNIIATSACLGSYLNDRIFAYFQEGDVSAKEDIHEYICWCIDTFGEENFFLELQPSSLMNTNQSQRQEFANTKLVLLANAYEINTIVATDSHYLEEKHKAFHASFLKGNEDKGDSRETGDFYDSTYLMDVEEIERKLLNHLPQEEVEKAFTNTMKIYDMIEIYEIEKPIVVPRDKHIVENFKVQHLFKDWYDKCSDIKQFAYSEEINDRYFLYLVEQGFTKFNQPFDLEHISRINIEIHQLIAITAKLGEVMSKYYTLVRNLIHNVIWDISLIPPGRGSVAGFYCAYLLEICQISAIDYGLPWWRHLHESKVSLADIDIDTEKAKRGQIFEGMQEYYGIDNVLSCLTHTTVAAKSAILMAGRGLGYNKDEMQGLADLIPIDRGKVRSLKQCINGDEEKDFKPVTELVNKMKKYPELLETAGMFEGLVNGRSIHASAIYIFDDGFLKQNSLMISKNGVRTTAFTMEDSDALSALKMDLLTVEAADKIRKCIELLCDYGYLEKQATFKETYYKYLHPSVIQYTEPKMWKKLNEGKIYDAFQMDTIDGSNAIRMIQPQSLRELSAANSLMRLQGETPPINKYIEYKADINKWYEDMRKEGLIESEIETLKNILADSYGIACEQEAVMILTQSPDISNFSMSESDKLRKIIAKKKIKLVEEIKQHYYEKGYEAGVRKEMLDYVWNYQIKYSLGYSFSLLHTTAYSIILIQEMNLSYYYPGIFWDTACLICNSSSDEENTGDKVNYVKISKTLSGLGREIISAPNINEAQFGFAPDVNNNKIIFSLKAISNINDVVAREIVNNRPYTSFDEFLTKMTEVKKKYNEAEEDTEDDSEESNKKFKLSTVGILNLIKAGAFDEFEDRQQLMQRYCSSVAKTIKNITSVQIPALTSLGMFSDEDLVYVKYFEFKKLLFVKENVVDKQGKSSTTWWYKITYCLSKYFIENILLYLKEDQYKEDDAGNYAVKRGAVEKAIDNICKDFKEKISQPKYLETFNSSRFNEVYEKFECDESISHHEIKTLGVYLHDHELAHVDYNRYNITKYQDVPNIPIVKEEKQWGDRKIYIYELFRICGTCLGVNKTKHVAYLLTPEDDIVTVKYYAGNFVHYNQKNSKEIDGKNVTVEESWFKRGTLLLISGIKRDDMFFAKSYKTSIFNNSTMKITKVTEENELRVQEKRVGEDECND